MYLIQAKVDATAPDFPGQDVEWKAGQVKFVHESLIEYFKANPAAWTVVSDLDQVPVMGKKTLTGGISFQGAARCLATQQRLMRSPLSVSVLGNSFSNVNPNWFYEAVGRSAGTFRINTVGGVFGNNSAQMLARVTEIPDSSDVCFVLEGSNDAAQGVTSQAHASNLIAICKALIDQGTLPIIILSPPQDGKNTAQVANRVAEYRAASLLGIPAYDIFGQYFDTASGNWIAGASGDGVHPNQLQYRDAGKALIAQILSPTASLLLPKSSVWGADLLTDNLFVNASGGLGSGWSKLGSGVASVSDASADGVAGNWQTITATALAAGTTGVYKNVTLPAGYSDSDKYAFGYSVKSTNGSGGSQIFVFIRWKNSGGSGLRDDGCIYANAHVGGTDVRKHMYELTPPAGAVSAQVYAYLSSGSTFTASLSIGEVTLTNLRTVAGI